MRLTVIWISHDLGVIAGLAQVVNVMYAGHLVERGPVRRIYKAPCHPYTIGLLASMPRLDRRDAEKLRSIPGTPPDMTKLPPGCPFAPRCGFAGERCRTAMPPVEPVDGQGHAVRCWHWRAAAGAA
jgi:oligopeptide/dipeptide ABC transporter ATP-binding protein